MYNLPLISIVIPMFNSSKFIEETLNSIKNQKYSNWECIIVDDGSNDFSFEITTEITLNDNRFNVIRRPNNIIKGANSCRNFGFIKSRGVFINWFDSDDIMLDNFLSEKVKVINENLDLIITSGYSSSFDLKVRKLIELKKTDNLYKDFALAKLRILTPSILFRKSFLQDKILFLDWIKRGQESEFYLRLFFELDSTNFVILNEHLFVYRSHNSSISSLNKVYREDFKESELYIVKQNFERAYKLNDRQLLRSSLRLLINLWKLSIINKHYKNNIEIFNLLNIKLYFKNKSFILLLKMVKRLSRYCDLSFTKWDKILKRYPINF